MLGLILGIPVNVYASLCLFARLLCLLGRVYLCLLDLTIYLSVLGLVCLCVFVLSLLVCLLDLPISSLCYIFRNLLDPLAICCTPARSVFLSFYSGKMEPLFSSFPIWFNGRRAKLDQVCVWVNDAASPVLKRHLKEPLAAHIPRFRRWMSCEGKKDRGRYALRRIHHDLLVHFIKWEPP